MLTGFVALQDVTVGMGPTVLWAGTHTAAAHAAWGERPSLSSPKPTVFAGAPLLPGEDGHARTARARVGYLSKGDMLLFDARLLHCGCENSSRRRWLFYFSMKRRGAWEGVGPGTLLGSLRGVCSLGGADEWLHDAGPTTVVGKRTSASAYGSS